MKPTNLISTAFASELSQNYVASRSILESVNEDATSVWYSIEEIETYLAYLKTEAQAKDYLLSGIRFYFGVYPDHFIDTEKAGMTTVFMCPTGNKNTEPQNTEQDDIVELSAMNYGGYTKPKFATHPKKK